MISVKGILRMDRYLTKLESEITMVFIVTFTKRPRLPSDSDDDHDGQNRIEGWATGATAQGAKAGITKMMEKTNARGHKTTVLPGVSESINPALMTGQVNW
jgi:hypothetical protein